MPRLDVCDSARRAGTVALLATVLVITAVDATAQLTPEHVARVAWIEETAMSPDGRWVAYIRSLPAGPGQATRGRARDQFLIPTAGGEPRLVSAEQDPASPSWSPDAARLAFLAEITPPRPSVWSPSPGPAERHLLRGWGSNECRAWWVYKMARQLVGCRFTGDRQAA
jgi:dipeptidyl aminopeptidase/acylaminoacyl peptidase